MSAPQQQQARTQIITPTHMYLKLRFESEAQSELNLANLLSIIDAAARSLYGIVGAASLEYHLESVQPEPNTAILRVPTSHHRRLWAAITTITRVEKESARFLVVCASPFWMALFEEGEQRV